MKEQKVWKTIYYEGKKPVKLVTNDATRDYGPSIIDTSIDVVKPKESDDKKE